jgi:hypothetical protein
MVTNNVISRVFHLKYGDGTGTCFAIDYDNKQYLVTAKHVISDLEDNDQVEIYFNSNWVKVNVRLVGHHEHADISVFCIDTLLAKAKMEPISHGIIYGQDTYFLGFPYRLQDENSSQINRNFPIPLVKKATLSFITQDEFGSYLILDGINNPGFSGGPVVFTEPNKNEYKVAAVISGYKSATEPTYHQDQQTPITVKANTGLIIAYNISQAIELIEKNPIGKEIE